MGNESSRLTVYFEDPFWIGILKQHKKKEKHKGH